MNNLRETLPAGLRMAQAVRVLGVGALLAFGVAHMASAASPEDDARQAITRAQAKIDLVSKETPAATQNPAFTSAQQKLAGAIAAMDRSNERDALWLATEADVLAETTAGASKLAGLERTRGEVARDLEILESELRKE